MYIISCTPNIQHVHILCVFFCIDNHIFIMSNCHNNNNKYHPHPQHASLVIDC